MSDVIIHIIFLCRFWKSNYGEVMCQCILLYCVAKEK